MRACLPEARTCRCTFAVRATGIEGIGEKSRVADPLRLRAVALGKLSTSTPMLESAGQSIRSRSLGMSGHAVARIPFEEGAYVGRHLVEQALASLTAGPGDMWGDDEIGYVGLEQGAALPRGFDR